MGDSLNTIRYLSFEINNACPNAALHEGKCPISHPDRYKFSKSNTKISDSLIIEFWRWTKTKGFRGIILWHMYNEPVLVLARIMHLMHVMKEEDPFQAFQLTTSIEGDYKEFDIVKISDYTNGFRLDKRIEAAKGDGKAYDEMPKKGWCGRGLGWEIPIDYYGNWCLCCGDWCCEEAVGSICTDDWEYMLMRYFNKRKRIKWNDESSYYRMPRLCRSCLDKNPTLSKRGGI
jgi:hypothetical protein